MARLNLGRLERRQTLSVEDLNRSFNEVEKLSSITNPDIIHTNDSLEFLPPDRDTISAQITGNNGGTPLYYSWIEAYIKPDGTMSPLEEGAFGTVDAYQAVEPSGGDPSNAIPTGTYVYLKRTPTEFMSVESIATPLQWLTWTSLESDLSLSYGYTYWPMLVMRPIEGGGYINLTEITNGFVPQINTGSHSAIPNGDQIVTPIDMTNIQIGTYLYISDGINGEVVTVLNITTTTFTAHFTNNYDLGEVNILGPVVYYYSPNGIIPTSVSQLFLCKFDWDTTEFVQSIPVYSDNLIPFPPTPFDCDDVDDCLFTDPVEVDVLTKSCPIFSNLSVLKSEDGVVIGVFWNGAEITASGVDVVSGINDQTNTLTLPKGSSISETPVCEEVEEEDCCTEEPLFNPLISDLDPPGECTCDDITSTDLYTYYNINASGLTDNTPCAGGGCSRLNGPVMIAFDVTTPCHWCAQQAQPRFGGAWEVGCGGGPPNVVIDMSTEVDLGTCYFVVTLEFSACIDPLANDTCIHCLPCTPPAAPNETISCTIIYRCASTSFDPAGTSTFDWVSTSQTACEPCTGIPGTITVSKV